METGRSFMELAGGGNRGWLGGYMGEKWLYTGNYCKLADQNLTSLPQCGGLHRGHNAPLPPDPTPDTGVCITWWRTLQKHSIAQNNRNRIQTNSVLTCIAQWGIFVQGDQWGIQQNLVIILGDDAVICGLDPWLMLINCEERTRSSKSDLYADKDTNHTVRHDWSDTRGD